MRSLLVCLSVLALGDAASATDPRRSVSRSVTVQRSVAVREVREVREVRVAPVVVREVRVQEVRVAPVVVREVRVAPVYGYAAPAALEVTDPCVHSVPFVGSFRVYR